MKEKFLLTLVVLIFDVLSAPLLFRPRSDTPAAIDPRSVSSLEPCHGINCQAEPLGHPTMDSGSAHHHRRGATFVSLVEAKGVAGLGKAGGDGTGGADKAGTQVPPEVYNALTYAGTAFLFTLSVPLILYGLNKLLNKIEDCFGCGPASKKKKLSERQLENQQLVEQVNSNNKINQSSLVGSNLRQQFDGHRALTNQAKNYHHHNQQQSQQPHMTNQSPRIASFPANKNPHSGSNSHDHRSASSRQNSPAVPAMDSGTITLPFDSDHQDHKGHHTILTTPTTTAPQNNYHQSAPYIISPPHI